MNTLAYLWAMGLFRLVFRLYVRGSFHVAVALLSLVCLSALVLQTGFPAAYYGALFFGSVAGYNAIKYGAEPWKHRPGPGGHTRLIFWLSMACLAAAGLFLGQLPAQYWVLSGACALLAALYALPVFPGFRNLRSFGLLKVPLVAVVWTAATLWIPVWASGGPSGWDFGVESFQRLMWICLLMLPFEIRDMHTDPQHMRTLPRRWGLPATRKVAWAGALLFFAATGMKDLPSGPEILSKGVAALLTALAVQFSRERQPPYYASFWVESIPVLATLLLWAGLWFLGH